MERKSGVGNYLCRRSRNPALPAERTESSTAHSTATGSAPGDALVGTSANDGTIACNRAGSGDRAGPNGALVNASTDAIANTSSGCNAGRYGLAGNAGRCSLAGNTGRCSLAGNTG